MKLNHLNLVVSDPPSTQAFLVEYFGLTAMGKPNENICFLTDDSGSVISLSNMKLAMETEVKYPANFHIGFIQESELRVDEINRRLKDDGYDVPLPSRQHGAWTFYFMAPGNFSIEVLA